MNQEQSEFLCFQPQTLKLSFPLFNVFEGNSDAMLAQTGVHAPNVSGVYGSVGNVPQTAEGVKSPEKGS